MPQTGTSFRVTALDADELDEIRSRGVDAFGNAISISVDEEGGAPVRCCLTEAQPGERIALIAHRPFGSGGPFAEVGPVYVHAERCPGYQERHAYPAGFRHRAQVFRAYGHDGTIVDAEMAAGDDAEDAIGRLLARPEVAFLHSRNVLYGCYMFAIERDGDGRIAT
jgi:hypothetical protein